MNNLNHSATETTDMHRERVTEKNEELDQRQREINTGIRDVNKVTGYICHTKDSGSYTECRICDVSH